jgi:metal-responsive CopG/Arc/MetJ family transcriptional regulator
MRNTVPIGISLPRELLKKIDQLRGKIPRSVYIRDLLMETLQDKAANSSFLKPMGSAFRTESKTRRVEKDN